MSFDLSNRVESVVSSIGGMKESTDIIGSVGNDLRRILSGHSTRGKLGEILIELILSDVLPQENYERQMTLGSKRVDFAVKTKQYIIPIDSKFPLSNYERFIEAIDQNEKDKFLRELKKDVKKHIDAVSEYVMPELNTSSYAIMYIPAESIYYQIISDIDIIHYSLDNQVLMCSPCNLHYVLHSLHETIRREKIPQEFERILCELDAFNKDLESFSSEYDTVVKHITAGYNKSQDVQKLLHKLKDKTHSMGST